MGGDKKVAEAVIGEAERQRILKTETLEYLRGTMYLYGGRPPRKRAHISKHALISIRIGSCPILRWQ